MSVVLPAPPGPVKPMTFARLRFRSEPDWRFSDFEFRIFPFASSISVSFRASARSGFEFARRFRAFL